MGEWSFSSNTEKKVNLETSLNARTMPI